MDKQSTVRSAWQSLKDAHEDMFTIFRDLKWLIAISAIACVVLYLPNQVRELYRISAANGGVTALKQLVAVFAIGLCIWFGAFQIATETSKRVDCTNPWTAWFLRILPIALGALPMLAAVVGQLQSRPTLKGLDAENLEALRQVGNIFRIQENALSDDGIILIILAIATATLAIAFAVRAWKSRDAAMAISASANRRYFSHPLYGLVT